MRIMISTCIVVVVLLASGCKDLGTPPSESVNPDEVLRNSIIGTWRDSDNYRVSFRGDGTFVDTSLFVAQFGLAQVDTLILSLSGQYSVQDSVVDFSNVHFSYWTASGKPFPGLSLSSMPQLVRVHGDSLLLTPENVLVRVSPTVSGTLEGAWRSLTWRLGFRSDSLSSGYTSRQEEVHAFANASHTHSETVTFLDASWAPVITNYGSYQYTPPQLQISTLGGSLYRVSVVSSRMYWFSDQWAKNLIRFR